MNLADVDKEVQLQYVVKTQFFNEIGYEPHKFQNEVHFTSHLWDFFVAAWGRRSGKTLAAAMEVVWTLSQPDKHIWIAAPTYKLTKKVYREVWKLVVEQEVLGPWNEIGVSRHNSQQDMSIHLQWGSWVETVTADNPVNLLGEGLDLLVVDEAARVGRMVYEEALEPTVLEREGKVLLISTPRGHNWFYEKWEFGQQRLRGWASSQMKSEQNPHISTRYLEGKRFELDPVTYRQEYEASFEHHTGLIWGMFRAMLWPHGHLWNDEVLEQMDLPPIPASNTMHVRAIDPGMAHPTGCLWAQITPADDIFFYQEYLKAGLTAKPNAQNIIARTKHPIDLDLMDPEANKRDRASSRAQTIMDVYRELGIHPIEAPNDHTSSYMKVANYLEATLEANPSHPRMLFHESMVETIRQMQNYEYKEGKSEDSPAPEKARRVNDDLVDPVRYTALYEPRWDMRRGQRRSGQRIEPVRSVVPVRGRRIRPTAGLSS